jgi:hypothetical protein
MVVSGTWQAARPDGKEIARGARRYVGRNHLEAQDG